MSRKRKAPKKVFYPDAKYGSLVLAKFINFIMYDGKKATAEKIIYNTLDKIKEKTNEDPIKIFNDAIGNIRPNLEVRSRRVGGATYQVPVEVRAKRSQTLALRWLLEATRKRKNKTIIGNKSFIGSNTSLIAPVKIGKNVKIGAGSVINKDIPTNKLAIKAAPKAPII